MSRFRSVLSLVVVVVVSIHAWVRAEETARLEFKERETATVTVDAAKHCVFLAQSKDIEQGRLRIPLERGVKYTVMARGEAFMTDQTGIDADPFPGVMIFYCEDAEDGYATRYRVLKPNETVTFTTPQGVDAKDVFLLAFYLDCWPESANHGSYELEFTREPAVHVRR